MNLPQLKRTICMDLRRAVRILPATLLYTLLFLLVSLVVIKNGENLFFDPNRYTKVPVGLSMPLNSDQDKSGLKLVEDNAHRKEVAHMYYEGIKNPLVTMPDLLPDEQNAYHLFPILVGEGKRDALHNYLDMNGVGTVIHYPIAPHKQECYKEWNEMNLPITEQIANEELSLPIGPSIKMEEVVQIVDFINKFV